MPRGSTLSSGGSAKKKAASKSSSSAEGRGEIQRQKSPAEFFADNQAIAGFDNYGKSLYTSIRELMENSLDACESIGVLPTIKVYIEELNKDEFNKVRGISVDTKDTELFETKGGKGTSAASAAGGSAKKRKSTGGTATNSAGAKSSATKPRKKATQEGYFQLRVRDNGCGMKHDKIPDLLGRVLSGSKYGVRQTRGKFGLGAKMALIWSKKSTGVPIKVTTAHLLLPKSKSKANNIDTSSLEPPKTVSTCVLDIDITKNCPNIIEHSQRKNDEGWMGTELELLIAGNWTTYRSRIVSYLQQLAIITPYAQLELVYENRSEPHRNMTLRHDRRSEQMPPLPKEIKHHPSSVNNIIVSQLIERSNHKTIIDFLTKELSCVTRNLAVRIVKECGWDEDEIVEPSSITGRDLTKLVQVLRTVQMFKAPDGSCLSPLGEYNLNLGIRKVLEPEYVATSRDKPSAYEGHPFLVEAAVSLGGKEAKEGMNVVRFANRIPLLFEAGADVCTRVATSKINWSSYKIDQKRDKIGVFVSIVSTKIPYKGTGKEYIGDDITEISVSVKRALQLCCQQLRVHLMKRKALRDQRDRKSKLVKYIPDVSRSLFELLEGMRKRREELIAGVTHLSSPRKRPRTEQTWQEHHVDTVVERMEKGEITASIIKKNLEEAVNVQNLNEEEEEAKRSNRKDRIPLFMKPMFNMEDATFDIEHPLFTFRPMACPGLGMPPSTTT
mmetsp:Transcript_23092/g.64022  ORF Transcript_23092/g.64022 Transcript_23092/m.64022 type:complete len:724 (-) Transcript_23092:3965-6136(-)